MSSVYQPKRKEMAKVKIVSSETYSKDRKKLNLVGSIQRNLTNFITTQRNKKTGKCSFVDDTSSLTKRAKKDVVNITRSHFVIKKHKHSNIQSFPEK